MKLVKEIKAKDGKVHFRRWSLFESNVFSIYYHEIFAADKDKHLHNHPWNIFTLILSGAYLEQLEHKKYVARHRGSMAFRKRNVFHKIHTIFGKKVTTLAICFGKREPWGYRIGETAIVTNEEYRKLKHAEDYSFVNHRKQ
jgi:hypothetical protein